MDNGTPDNTELNGGKKANQASASLVGTVRLFLEERGFTTQSIRSAGRNIYGGRLPLAVFCTGIKQFPNGLAVEARSQESKGTASAKLLYLIENIKERYPCPAVIILSGRKINAGVIQYAKSKVDGRKLIGVFQPDEFKSWVTNLKEQES